MRDPHLIYTDLPDGKIKIIPEDGYRMVCTVTKKFVSEAIAIEKELKYFVSQIIEAKGV